MPQLNKTALKENALKEHWGATSLRFTNMPCKGHYKHVGEWLNYLVHTQCHVWLKSNPLHKFQNTTPVEWNVFQLPSCYRDAKQWLEADLAWWDEAYRINMGQPQKKKKKKTVRGCKIIETWESKFTSWSVNKIVRVKTYSSGKVTQLKSRAIV